MIPEELLSLLKLIADMYSQNIKLQIENGTLKQKIVELESKVNEEKEVI